MIIFSDAIGDTPPGTGYLTVATITISAIPTDHDPTHAKESRGH
jgi:hypothetical protein